MNESEFSLISIDDDGLEAVLQPLGRALVALSVAMAWLASIGLTGAAALTDRFRFDHVVAPVTAAIVLTLVVWIRRNAPRPPVVEIASVALVVTVGGFEAFGEPATSPLALIGMLVTGWIAVPFLTDRLAIAYLVAFSIMVGLLTAHWGHGMYAVPEALAVAAVAGVVGVGLLAARSALVKATSRSHKLLSTMPIAVFEQDWRKARRALRELEHSGSEQLEEALRNRPELVSRIVGLVEIRATNPAAADMLQPPDPGMLARISHGRVTEQNIGFFIRQLVAVHEGADRFEGLLETSTYRGEHLDVQLAWTRDPSTRGGGYDSVVVTAVDVTTLRNTEAELRRLLRQKDAFIVSASHELRTPLTGVVAISHGLTDDPRVEDPDVREMIHLLRSEAGVLAATVDNLVVASRLESGTITVDRRPMLVHELVAEIAAETRIEVHESWTGSEDLIISADPGRIEHALRNIIGHARHHGSGPPGISVTRAGTTAVIEILEPGPAITPQTAERLFGTQDPIRQSHGITEVFGVALAVARRLVEVMGGSLQYGHRDGVNSYRLEFSIEPA